MSNLDSASATGLPATTPCEPRAVFDPVEYIADMRAAGVTVCLFHNSYLLSAEEGFGDEFMHVCRKWGEARHADPDSTERVVAALEAEPLNGVAPRRRRKR